MLLRRFLLLVSLVFCVGAGYARELPSNVRSQIDAMINRGLNNKAFPGASFLVGDRNGIIYEKYYGGHDYSGQAPVTTEDIYDIASCTKILSTTFVTMKLYDEGKIRLGQKIGDLVPQVKNTRISDITVQELMTHTSGIPPQVFHHEIAKNPLYFCTEDSGDYRRIGTGLYINPAVDTMILNRVCKGYVPANRGKYNYNDSNFYLMRLAVENITGKPLEVLTAELFDQLDCRNTGYNPLEWKSLEHIMPTEIDIYLRKCLVQGYVHDEFAAVLGGIGGHAGLFSNVRDMSCFCEMMLNDGEFRGKRILSRETVRIFTASPLSSKGVYRGIGFDKRSAAGSKLGGDDLFGHTGFTGCIFWEDRAKGFYMIFLSNSVYTTRNNTQLNDSGLRTNIWALLEGAAF